MDRIAARTLHPWEGRRLRHMKQERANGVNSRHAQVILLSRGGLRNREIAERAGYTPTWVRKIICRFNTGGTDAITWYPYFCNQAGPRKFFAQVVEQIAEVALSPPRQLIGMSVWSLAKLRQYLVEQKILPSISLEWLRHILRERRIRWRHTKTWKESRDPDFWPKYRRIRRLYRRRPKDGIRLSMDEFGPLNLQPRQGKHYAHTEHVDRVRATYSRRGGVRQMFAVYNMERDTLVGWFVEKKNWQTFLMFLKMARRHYRRSGVLHIALDNVGYHLKSEVLAYAKTHRIKFYLTPTNASWLNRIECHLTALKKFVFDNSDYRSHTEQQEAIQRYLDWRNGARELSIQSWRSYRRRHRKAA